MLDNQALLGGREPFSVTAAIAKMVALPALTLSPVEGERFIEKAWDLSKMKLYARRVPMKGRTLNIQSVSWGSGDFFHPEGQFNVNSVRTEFGSGTQLLTSQELRAGMLIKDSDYEDLTIGTAAQFKAHIFSMAQKRMAKELEEICWMGDTADLSAFADTNPRSVVDGWRYRIDHSQSGETYEDDDSTLDERSAVILDASNTVTAAAADYGITTAQTIVETDASAPYEQEIKFNNMIKYLPAQYKMLGLSNLRYLTNDKIVTDYHQALQARQTALGDNMIVRGESVPQVGMIPIIGTPLMPTNMKIDVSDVQKEAWVVANGDLTDDAESGAGDLVDCILTPDQNLGIGIQLAVVMEAERSAQDRGNIYYFTTRIAPFVGDVAAVVLLKRLKVK